MRSFAIIGLFAVAGGAFGVAGCQPAKQSNGQENTATAEPAPSATLPIREPPIDREQLLRRVAIAASATALGREDAEQQQALDGKPFEVRIRFGCPSSKTAEGAEPPFGVGFDQENRTLRVRAEPDLTLDDEGVAAIAGKTVEAVEGFWMYRPWLLDDGCPTDSVSRDAAVVPAVTARPRLGLAQFFTENDPRTGRRDDRPYEATKVLPEGEQTSSQGYNLVVSGRLRRLPQGKVITCRLIGVNYPPECIVSAAIDRVQVEQPDTHVMIAEWSR